MSARYLESFGCQEPLEPDPGPIAEWPARYDADKRRWTCTCPMWRRHRGCWHVHRRRGENTIQVKEEYL